LRSASEQRAIVDVNAARELSLDLARHPLRHGARVMPDVRGPMRALLDRRPFLEHRRRP
jgi:hypothetical protein